MNAPIPYPFGAPGTCLLCPKGEPCDLRDCGLISHAEFHLVLALPHKPYANSFALILVESLA